MEWCKVWNYWMFLKRTLDNFLPSLKPDILIKTLGDLQLCLWRPQGISTQENCVFLTLTKWVLYLNLTRALTQHCHKTKLKTWPQETWSCNTDVNISMVCENALYAANLLRLYSFKVVHEITIKWLPHSEPGALRVRGPWLSSNTKNPQNFKPLKNTKKNKHIFSFHSYLLWLLVLQIVLNLPPQNFKISISKQSLRCLNSNLMEVNIWIWI